MKTTKDIVYRSPTYGLIGTIPAGTEVSPATNLPNTNGCFWAEPWEGMTEKEESWSRNYGFLVTENVE